MHQLAVAGDGNHGAGHAIGGDLTSKELIDARQAFFGKSGFLRRGDRQRCGGACGN